ncbi:hypothetical protein IT411_00320 [Candidatus Peregrinibacteria bacterium]|nr:hypothetical protein [Candidatus Peregrinibacteria bacterium]
MKIVKSMLAGVLAAAVFVGAASGIEYVKKQVLPGENQNGNLILPDIAMAQTPSGAANPICYDNYQSWNSSTTYKTDADWSTWFASSQFPNSGTSKITNNFERDINGDGLPDYMYVYHIYNSSSGYNYNQMSDCVYLSNGHGWDLAYRCFVIKPNTSTPVTYYGNCAA